MVSVTRSSAPEDDVPGTPHHLVDGRMGVPAESTTVKIDLVEKDGATTLRLVHDGLPPGTVREHEQGLAHFLDALRDILSAA
jgi:Activator of Hsp90 ATPase homolog 1-like protein